MIGHDLKDFFLNFSSSMQFCFDAFLIFQLSEMYVLYCIALQCIVFYCVVLYCILLYSIVFYCILLIGAFISIFSYQLKAPQGSML